MKPHFLFRLALDLLAVGLLLTAMAYFAFDNATHEIVGTAMFLLLITHNIFNRRWYGTITKGRHDASGLITKALNLSLLLAMLTLLATSLIISQTVFSFLPLASTFTVRQTHTFVAYMALLTAGLHLGLHWTMLLGIIRSRFRVKIEVASSPYILPALAVALAAGGVYSFFAQKVGLKLLMLPSFAFGDIQMPVPIFILQHVAIVGLFACLAHYTLKVLRGRTTRRSQPR